MVRDLCVDVKAAVSHQPQVLQVAVKLQAVRPLQKHAEPDTETRAPMASSSRLHALLCSQPLAFLVLVQLFTFSCW